MSNNPKTGIITLSHGSGGRQSHALIKDIFARHFSNSTLNEMGDAALLEVPSKKLAFTTDSFVVKPLFFPGGDIGKLAICGTVNDLAVAGARPLYITAGFIIEEGLPIETLDRIAASMASAANEAQVKIVAGDTKVVEKGACDKIFINTSGIGEIISAEPISTSALGSDDVIIMNGPIADHGMAIMAAREGLSIKTPIESDCAALNGIIEELLKAVPNVKFMRDITRGGLATVLNEMCEEKSFGINIEEKSIPVREATKAVCEILGIDPLYVANEGKFLAVVPKAFGDKALAALRLHPLGKDAAAVGLITSTNAGKVTLTTELGTKRMVPMLSGDQLPRIC